LDSIDAHAGEVDNADLIFVFGTRHWTPAELAAELYLSGRSRLIVTTGGSQRHPRGLSEAAVHRDLLLAAGVPADDVVAETQSLTTAENVAFAAPLIESRIGQVRTVLAVVKWYHRRALVLLAKQMPSIERIYAADYDPFNTVRRISLSRSNWQESCAKSVARERDYMASFVAEGTDVLTRTDAGWVRSSS
jgi:uncharacterized SAM-binding protein YcdF (DUF218 family)